jgi:chorismate synthase
MKGVEIGLGFEAARRFGSQVHDEIQAGYTRASNNAGGLEGGMTTGAPLVVRVAMKPLSTLMRPLQTVNIATGGQGEAVTERSDVAALAAAGVVGEAMVATVLANAVLEKFGSDSMSELQRNFEGYTAYLHKRAHTDSTDSTD